MKTVLICATLTVLTLLVSASVVYAADQELVIEDTSGVVRNVTAIDSTASIEFTLTDAAGMPADGVEVLFKNKTTGEELRRVSANGIVVFEDVTPGTWTVSTNADRIVFSNILVSAAYAASTAGGYAARIAMLAGGGAAVAGTSIAIAESSDSKGAELSPSS